MLVSEANLPCLRRTKRKQGRRSWSIFNDRMRRERDELIAGRFAREKDLAYLCSRDDKCAYK